MAKTHQIKYSSSFDLSPKKQEIVVKSVEKIKNQDHSELSNALLRKGEFRLINGDKSGLNYFDMALKLNPSNPRLYIDQGLALFEFGSRKGSLSELTLSSKRFKTATTLDPTSFEAWHLWGNTLYLLGKKKNEPNYFINARKKYEKAFSLKKGQPPDILADLNQDIGDLWTKLGEISEEVADYLLAIKAYDQVIALQKDLPLDFWMKFGKVYFTLGNKTNDLRFFIKAINCYNKVLSTNTSYKAAWYNLAEVLSTLYSYTHDEDHFSQANECYQAVSQLLKSQKTIYLSWAKLLFESGSIFSDVKKLKSCIEKCQCAHKYDPNDPYIISIWTKALAYLGTITDNLELLYEAQNKIDPIIEQHEDPEILYSYGIVLHSLGIYYKDSDYYYQAIEIFQEGLSINRSHYKLWYGMAESTFAAALIDQDEKNFERANHFFERSFGLKVTSTIHCRYATFLSKYAIFLQDENMLQQSIYHFEQAIRMQKNVYYLHLDWIFNYAVTLDHLSNFVETENHYLKALDSLNHILMVNPKFPGIHHQLASVYSHYAELTHQIEIFYRSIHHYRIAHQNDKENDQIILDWSLVLVNLGDLLENNTESDYYFREAEYKMIQSAKLGNVHAYYFLACLYSLLENFDHSLKFLQKAKNFDGLPPIEEIIEDEWLENVRETNGFHSFLAELESNIPD